MTNSGRYNNMNAPVFPGSSTRVLFLVLLLFILTSTTEAFAPSYPSSTATKSRISSIPYHEARRSSTSLSMIFDWFNPKPKPPAPAPAPAPVEEAKDEVVAKQVVEQLESSTPPAPAAEAQEAPVTAAETASAEVSTGTVTFFNPKRGYGFINSISSDEKDIFVHQSEIQAPGFRFLVKGETVEFQTHTDDQGRLCASHVTGPDGGDVKITLRRNKKRQEAEEEG